MTIEEQNGQAQGLGIHIAPTVDEHEEVLSRAILQLSTSTPRNEFGFPLGIYRPDLLPLHDYQPEAEAVSSLFLQPTGPLRDSHLENSKAAAAQGGGSPFSVLSAEGYLDDVSEDQEEDEEDEDELDIEVELEEPPNGSDSTSESRESHVSRSESRLAGFRREHLKAAFIPLSYEEGYPTLPDGRPIWDRLDYEPASSYLCFQAYLEMPKVAEGVRTLSELPTVMEANSLLHVNGFDKKDFVLKFRHYSSIYYWNLRAKSYDLFRAAAYRKKQEIRSLDVQDVHYSIAEKLLGRLLEYMESEEDFWDMMSPKVAESLLKTLTGIQRVSVGLPMSTPAVKGEGGSGTQTFEMILRTLTQGNSVQRDPDSDGVLIDGETGGVASRILGDPEATKYAQELILRLSRKNEGA